MVRKGKPVSKQKSKQSSKKDADTGRAHETIRRDLIINESQKQEMETEIPTMRVITPSTVAQKYGVRVSIAKAVLTELESKGLIKKVIRNGKFKLYTKSSA